MPTGRFLHQAVRVGWDIYVLGGKDGALADSALATVSKLRIHEYSKRIPIKGQAPSWIDCAPMTQGRCLFAATVLGNFIYAYGGITSSKKNKPTLADKLVERYDTVHNKWTPIVVENAPALAAFGWTLGPKEGELLVLGGSTGLELTSELWSIDLKTGKATNTGIEYESATSLIKLSTYEPNDKSFLLFSFGGA